MKYEVHCVLIKFWAARFIARRNYAQRLFSRDKVNTLMIILFGLLHVADGVLTYLGLSFANVDEANPILNYFAGQVGLGLSIALLKSTIIVVIMFVFFARTSIKSRWGTATLAWADTFYSWVVTNNFILVVGAYHLVF